MGKWVRRIAIATAVSVGIHLGIAGGLQYSLPDKPKQAAPLVEQKPKMNAPPLEEKLVQKPEVKKELNVKKPDLNALRQEKEEFIQETLSKLNSGKKIRLSEFFIRAETLDLNIAMAEKGEFGPKDGELRERYFEILKKANAAVLGAEDEVEALHQSMHTILKGYFWESGSIVDALGKGWYNCSSSTRLFSGLLQDVLDKERFSILVFDDHLANVIGGKRVDAVEPIWKGASVKFDGCGLVVPPEVLIAAYLLNNGIGMGDIPKRLASFYEVRKSWHGCPTQAKNLNEPSGIEVNSYSMPKPGAKSGMTVPSHFVPNPGYLASTEHVVKMARALLAAYQVSESKKNEKIFEEKPKPEKTAPKITKMDGSIELIINHPIKIPKDVDWGEVLERFKEYFASNRMVGLWPERVKCVYPFALITPETIPEMIGSMPQKEAEKWKYYTKESICKRMKDVAENGQLSEIWAYQSFNFCPREYPEVMDALKRRYLRERNGDILRFSLGDARVRENFGFFMSEYSGSPSLEIKRKAAAGMIFADQEKACGFLKTLPEGERIQLSRQLAWGCADMETAWLVVVRGKYETDEELSSLGRLEGKKLNAQQCGIIEQKGAAAPLNVKIEIARILVECGKAEQGISLANEAVRRFQNGEAMTTIGEGRFPRELNVALLPLLSNNRAAIVTSKGLICNGGFTEHSEKATEALRRIMADKEKNVIERVEAAYLLLQQGVEPLTEQ